MRHSVMVVMVVVVVARTHVCRLREKRHRLRLCDLYTKTPSGKKRATSLRCVEIGALVSKRSRNSLPHRPELHGKSPPVLERTKQLNYAKKKKKKKKVVLNGKKRRQDVKRQLFFQVISLNEMRDVVRWF